MKRAAFCISTLAIALGSSVLANANVDDTANASLQLDSGLMAHEAGTGTSSMTWPILPGESVSELARMFYPKNSAMQQLFVSKTLQLNSDIQLKSNQRFDSPTLLVIPTLKSLSKKNAAYKKSTNQSLKMSLGLKRIIQLAPEKLQQEYDELLSKNAFLKEQLAKLNKNILVLEAKLDSLKLIFDKTLNLANTNVPVPSNAPPVQSGLATAPVADANQAPVNQAKVQQATVQQAPVKKVFKNLNAVNKPAAATPAAISAPAPAAESTFFATLINAFNADWVKAILAAAALLLLSAFGLKKYREHLFAKLSFAATKMQNTVTDFSGYFEKTKLPKQEISPEAAQQQQAANEVETRLSATLEEAKLLMSVNRGTDAIAHLKMTIESQPKASINHWLYLLEVFRKLNLKAEFEQYANNMHDTFNVMTPVWYEKEAEMSAVMVVPQSLEEFPHIMEKLYAVWPGELASVYLRSLITDNRGGERVGFGKEVVSEILMLIALLDNYK